LSGKRLYSNPKEHSIFDAGRGIVRRIYQADIDPQSIRHLFLTHLHTDHTTGLPDFMYTLAVVGRQYPIKIWGPSGTISMITHIQQAYQEDIRIRLDGLEKGKPQAYQIEALECDGGVVHEESDVKIEAFPVNHGDWSCVGYKISIDEKTIVISGDTAPTPTLIEAAKNCDILIHEVYSSLGHSKRNDTLGYHPSMHTSSLELGKIASEVNPEKLVIYHQLYWSGSDEDIIADVQQNFSREIISARDLDVINI